jgi:hypothetical protein
VVIAAVIELIDIPGLITLYRVATRQLRGIGQVRDVLRRTEGERLPLSAYPTAREAIEALTHRL